jgi:DNA-binding MarR family transcriptional regulator
MPAMRLRQQLFSVGEVSRQRKTVINAAGPNARGPIRGARGPWIRERNDPSMSTKPANRDSVIEVVNDDFKLEDFLPFRLAVAASSVSRLMARRLAEAYGISIAEWRVLTMVGRYGTLSPSLVGDRTAMDKVKVSRAAASLVARGMIKQSQDPADGRGRLLRLTRKGANVFQGAIPLAEALEAELADGLNRSEWSALQKALLRLGAHVQAMDEPEAEAAD